MRELVAPGFVNHTLSGDQVGRDAFEQFLGGVWDVLPDIEVAVERAFQDGDRVGAVVVLRGTNQRFNRRVTVPEVQIYRVAEGKLAERWYAVDRTDLRPA